MIATATPRCVLALASSLLLAAPSVLRCGVADIFSDGFESGNTLAWSGSIGEPPLAPADAFRLTDLDLRDPHVFAPVLIFCADFTDQDLPGGVAPSLNSQIEASITTDGDSDGNLDLSTLLLFRPYSASAAGLRLDLASGVCVAPFPPAACGIDPTSLPQTSAYDALAGGTCLGPIGGTTSGYSPAVGSTGSPCWVSSPRPIVVTIAELELPLLAVQLAGGAVGDPPSGFVQGLLRGFLREQDADAILLPAELPIVGGQPLSVLLAGGTGSCAPGDDRDLFGGELGWWFYFAFTADSVLLEL